MNTNNEMPLEDVKHYAELCLSLIKASHEYYHGKKEDVEVVGRNEYLEDAILPKGLSDEDKFAVVLIIMYNSEIGLTTKRLKNYFGWYKSKCYKLARNCKYCHTVTLVCEEGGYGGTGWMLLSDMDKAILNYIRDNCLCTKCKYQVTFDESYSYGRSCSIIGCCQFNTQYVINEYSGCKNGYFELKDESNK